MRRGISSPTALYLPHCSTLQQFDGSQGERTKYDQSPEFGRVDSAVMQPYWIPLFILGSATPWFKSIPRVQTIVLVLLGISCLVSVRDGLDPRHRHNVKAILSGITAVFVFVWAAGLESGLIRVVPQGDTLRA